MDVECTTMIVRCWEATFSGFWFLRECNTNAVYWCTSRWMDWLSRTYPTTAQVSISPASLNITFRDSQTTSLFLVPKPSSATALLRWLVHRQGFRSWQCQNRHVSEHFFKKLLKTHLFQDSYYTIHSLNVKCLEQCPCPRH